ncbi:MAG: hypothetical protein LRS43_04890, partial [Desulfurococcales archaeon]|nr:hypothetical protein [Desulfurococcales archaeon]
MSLEERQYRIILRKTVRGFVIQFRSSRPETRETTLVRVGGTKAREIFNVMADALKKHGYVTEELGNENYRALRLKNEVGPIVGGFLVLIRRSREAKTWMPYFEDFLVDKYKGAKALLSHALSLGIELSKAQPPPERVRMQLNPKILDSIGSGFKVIARKL